MPPIRFYTDENIDSAVINGLRRRGIGVLSCHEAGLRTKSDAEHFDFFIANGYVLYTHDGGCVGRAAEMIRSGQSHTGIVYPKLCKLLANVIARSGATKQSHHLEIASLTARNDMPGTILNKLA